MAGSDVKSGHLHGSGYIYKGRARVRALDVVGSSSEGTLDIWDTDVLPVAGEYVRAATTVTVTDVGHGLVTGDLIGITFMEDSNGVIATPGNYEITRVDADTFTLTDINTGTITGDNDCYYVHSTTNGQTARWLSSYHTNANDIYFNGFNFPDEGLLARKGIYLRAENLVSINVYYS